MTTTGKRILFAVQGEGRGHLTQAITMQNILTEAGYEICGILLGTSSARKIPDFFFDQIRSPIYRFESPNFVTDANHKSIRILPSITKNLVRMPLYFRNMRKINDKIKELNPDLFINFYDPLIGMYYMLYNPKVPLVCIAHQYIFNHPDFQFPKGFFWQKLSLKIFTLLTASRAKRKLALSMYKLPDVEKDKLFVIPPLLRRDVYEQPITNGDYILIYLLNSGYMDDIIKWHKNHPDVKLHCFTDKADVVDEWKYDQTLSFHQINDKKFLELMAGCKAFASTAGFESICEALYFGKPTFMVPVERHFEQFSNARDSAKAGAGIYDSHFNLDKLIDYITKHKTDPEIFRNWASVTKEALLHHIDFIISDQFSININELSNVPVLETAQAKFPSNKRPVRTGHPGGG